MANKVFKIEDTPAEKPHGKRWLYADISMESEVPKWKLNKNRNPHDASIFHRLEITKDYDVNAVRNSLHNIFHWTKGERIINPEFGSEIKKYLYNQIGSFTEEQIMSEIKMMVAKWEPRCIIDKINRIGDITDVENNQVGIQLIWHVPNLPLDQYFTEIIF